MRLILLEMKDVKMRSSASAGLSSGSRPVGMLMKTGQHKCLSGVCGMDGRFWTKRRANSQNMPAEGRVYWIKPSGMMDLRRLSILLALCEYCKSAEHWSDGDKESGLRCGRLTREATPFKYPSNPT